MTVSSPSGPFRMRNLDVKLEMWVQGGSTLLEQQVRRVQPAVHVFGHTHVGWDTCLQGIRYVHWPLGNVKEQQGVAFEGISGLYIKTYT